MAYKLVTKSNNNNLLLLILIVVGILLFWYYSKQSDSEKFKLHPEQEDLICSKKCCHIGWEAAVKIDDDRIKDGEMGTKYNSSNINCNDGVYNTGCICLPNDIKK